MSLFLSELLCQHMSEYETCLDKRIAMTDQMVRVQDFICCASGANMSLNCVNTPKELRIMPGA